jgi:mannose-6-phosphate isomerase-like protein (cupin superfamily)
MRKTLTMIFAGAFFGSLVTLAAVYAQSGAASIKSKDATDISAAQIQAVLKSDAPDKNADLLVKVVDAGPYNLSMNVQHRIKTVVTEPQSTLHAKVSEIYYVLDGSATMITGGTLLDPKPSVYDPKLITPEGGNSTGPGVSGKVAGPYVTRKVGPGDVVFIPPMTNHWFSQIDNHINYLAFRVDNEHVLPAGYTHPILNSAGK